MNPRDWLQSETDKIFEAARKSDQEYKLARTERLQNQSYVDSMAGELRVKCLSAIEGLADAAQHPRTARETMLRALRDVQYAYSVAEHLDPKEDEE